MCDSMLQAHDDRTAKMIKTRRSIKKIFFPHKRSQSRPYICALDNGHDTHNTLLERCCRELDNDERQGNLHNEEIKIVTKDPHS